MMQFSWDFIRSFQAVAETGSLSAAARRLGLTQPTVGRHIDLLEDNLKVALFTRGRDGMRLTERGADLVASADELSRAATAFERHAVGLEEDISGTVRISANEILGTLILPRVLPALMDTHPEIEIEISVSNETANLLQRDADIAIRMFRPTQNDLLARKITDLPLGFYAHKSYLVSHLAPATLADFRDHRIIGFDRETSLIQGFKAMAQEVTRHDFVFRTDSILGHIAAIRSGIGIGLTHVGLAEGWPDVVRVLPDLPLPSLELWTACHTDVRFNRRVRAVIDFLADALRTPYG